jgi:diguanylate cyclase (GGDEF)-like protein
MTGRTAAVLDRSRGDVAAFRDRADDVTGLPGRRALQRHLATPVPAGLDRAVAMLDVDAFALVNQTYGPDAGDDLLRQIGARLAATAGLAVVGRWQADEFLYVVDAADAAGVLSGIVAAALAAVRRPVVIGDQRLYATVSAGLVTAALARDGDLATKAMHAVHAAKAAGRDRAVWFDGAADMSAPGGLRLANDLRRGMDGGELRLHFQPIVELARQRVVGVEALVRWERPGAGLLLPAAFIDIAERTGQIVALGAWVTDQACRTAVRLAQLGTGATSMSINLSARQLADAGVVDMLRNALRDSGCPPSSIVIEVTETALVGDLCTAIATLEAIKALGVTLALDDFGTGYSSLLYLKSFPVDRIKIDQSFVNGLGTDADDTAIVASTVSLGHSVGVDVVAEGVETAEQLTLLRQMGCDFAQGHLFSRALTLGQLQGWLRERQRPERRRAPRLAMTGTTVPETSHIFRLHREGASLHTIAAALNIDGRRTAVGLRWSPQSVAKVIAASRFPRLTHLAENAAAPTMRGVRS